MAGRLVYELTDFSLQRFEGREPEVIFTPSGPGVRGARMLAATPVVSIPNVNGAAAVTLESTDGVVPAVWYEVSIRVLQPGGRYKYYDEIPFRLFVPDGYDGSITNLPNVPMAPNTVWTSLDPPPPGFKGWWLYSPAPGQTMPLDDPAIGDIRPVS